MGCISRQARRKTDASLGCGAPYLFGRPPQVFRPSPLPTPRREKRKKRRGGPGEFPSVPTAGPGSRAGDAARALRLDGHRRLGEDLAEGRSDPREPLAASPSGRKEGMEPATQWSHNQIPGR